MLLTAAHPKGYSHATVIAVLIYDAGVNPLGTVTGSNGHYYVKELVGNEKKSRYDGFTGLQRASTMDDCGDPGKVIAVVVQFSNRKSPQLAHLLGPCRELSGPLSSIMKKAKITWDTQLCPGVVPVSDDEMEPNLSATTTRERRSSQVTLRIGKKPAGLVRKGIAKYHLFKGFRRKDLPLRPKHRLRSQLCKWKQQPTHRHRSNKKTVILRTSVLPGGKPGRSKNALLSQVLPKRAALSKRTSCPATNIHPDAPNAKSSSIGANRITTRSSLRAQDKTLQLLREEEYGVFSLFDGTSTTYTTITEEAGHAPTFFVAAEYEPTIRLIAADKHGLNINHLDPVWRPNKYDVPSRYLKDVWELLQDHGQILKELGQLFPSCKRLVIVAGSPCQDLTFMNKWKGLLGILGQRSKHFQIVPVLLLTLQILRPDMLIFLIIEIIENAGSMREVHKQAILDLLGMTKGVVKQIDAGTWGPVRRNRIFISNTIDFQKPGKLPNPWKKGWKVSQHVVDHVLMPWLRARGVTNRGNVILTSGGIPPVQFALLYSFLRQ
jgi:hypothetical protein